jgi:hypothetical protein
MFPGQHTLTSPGDIRGQSRLLACDIPAGKYGEVGRLVQYVLVQFVAVLWDAIQAPEESPVRQYSMYWCNLSQFQRRQSKNLKRTLRASAVCTGAICRSSREGNLRIEENPAS